MIFQLNRDFVETYSSVRPPFGFGALGEFTFYRTYSRPKKDGTNERWYETVERVVNGTYTMQWDHCMTHALPWSESKSQRSAQEMYDRIFNMKFLPPGRGLWAMGSPQTLERKIFESLNNCAFVSTEDIEQDLAEPFCFLMDLSMLGAGVGFDTLGAGTMVVKGYDNRRTSQYYQIEDSREGWVESIRFLVTSGLTDGYPWVFDYSKIRARGEPIRGFGGKASGPEPLKVLHDEIRTVLNNNRGQPITERSIVDIMNMIGKCVIAGNVRRTAELALGSNTEEFLNLKNYEQNPERKSFGWTSNNSIVATVGMDYGEAAERTRVNGEPGYIWLDNARRYGRMGDSNGEDYRVAGFNPCVEQPLESYEMCNLVELFPARHDSIQDFLRTAKFAYLYAKTVTLGLSHWTQTNRVLTRNRRIGASMTGVVQAIAKHSIETFREWCETTYQYIQTLDALYSDWLAVPRSIKTTTVKPSGTVSLLAGSTPGVHYPESRYYIRRSRVAHDSVLVESLQNAGYHLEQDLDDKTSYVVDFPIALDENIQTLDEVSIWQQFALAAFMQKHYSDNGVSCTVTFDPEKEGHMIKSCLEIYQYHLKAVSLLPRLQGGAYPQMPYEAINQEQYEEMSKDLQPLQINIVSGEHGGGDKFCDSDYCEI
jgi:adenosylcobalamin-dependent ribonucleoside-triphosphate reductase